MEPFARIWSTAIDVSVRMVVSLLEIGDNNLLPLGFVMFFYQYWNKLFIRSFLTLTFLDVLRLTPDVA